MQIQFLLQLNLETNRFVMIKGTQLKLQEKMIQVWNCPKVNRIAIDLSVTKAEYHYAFFFNLMLSVKLECIIYT